MFVFMDSLFKQNIWWIPNITCTGKEASQCTQGSSRFQTAEWGANLVQLLISEMGEIRTQEVQDWPGTSQRRLKVHSQPWESLCQWGKGHTPPRVCITGRACGLPGAIQVALQRSWYRLLIQYSEVPLILWCNKRL